MSDGGSDSPLPVAVAEGVGLQSGSADFFFPREFPIQIHQSVPRLVTPSSVSFNCGHMSARPSLSKKKAKVAQSSDSELSDVMSSESESESDHESDDGTVPCRNVSFVKSLDRFALQR